MAKKEKEKPWVTQYHAIVCCRFCLWLILHFTSLINSPCNNMFWLWLQMKEVGIYIVGCPKVARKVGVYFHNLWRLAHLNVSAFTATILDPKWQIQRRVPCWSHFIESDMRCTYVNTLHMLYCSAFVTLGQLNMFIHLRPRLPRFVEIPYVTSYPKLSDPKILKLIIDAPGYGYISSVPQSCYPSFAPP